MIDLRFHHAYALMVIDERIASLRRERYLEWQLKRKRPMPEPRPQRRGWAVADLVSRLAPNRGTR